jgi:hypothetical protein
MERSENAAFRIVQKYGQAVGDGDGKHRASAGAYKTVRAKGPFLTAAQAFFGYVKHVS